MASSEERRRVAKGLSGIVDEEPLSAWDEVYAVLFGSHRNPVYIDSYDMIDISIRTLAGIIDPGEDVSMSAYDLLAKEDRDALAWVRGHGGIEQVRLHHALGDGLSDLMDRVAERLGVSVEGLDAQDAEPALMGAIDRRLMPEGMHLPKDRDGREFWPSQPVWIDGQKMRVVAVTHKDKICVRKWEKVSGGRGKWVESTSVSSEEPPVVIDADGKPLNVGDVVWDVYRDEKMTVAEITMSGLVYADYEDKTGALRQALITDPDTRLTHERPDSWEYLESDAELRPMAYCHDRGLECGDSPDPDDSMYVEAMVDDIVRRARALAGRDA